MAPSPVNYQAANALPIELLMASSQPVNDEFKRALLVASSQQPINEFKRYYRSVDALLIDDIQFFARKERSQEEFFHTFNALVDQNRQVVISADKSPAELDGIEDRMKSRLGWGLVAEIHSTTYESVSYTQLTLPTTP